MVLESSRLWEEAEAEIGYKVYFKTSQLNMGASDNDSLLAAIDSCQKNSIPVRILDRDEVFEEFSGKFQLPEGWVGVVSPHGGVIKATKAVAMFQTLGVHHGAVLKDNTKVVDIKKNQATGDIVVFTEGDRKFRARKCVITVGAWTRKLIKSVKGITLPIQPLETAAYYWKINRGHEDKFTIESGFLTFASYGVPHIVGTPSLEFPELIKIPVDDGDACHPDERTWAAQPDLVDSLSEWIKGIFGELVDSNGPVITHSCMHSMTPDKDFVIHFLGGEFGEDVVVAGGFSGHGFKMAPLVGRITADMVATGRADGVDLTHFRVARFEGNVGANGDYQVNLS